MAVICTQYLARPPTQLSKVGLPLPVSLFFQNRGGLVIETAHEDSINQWGFIKTQDSTPGSTNKCVEGNSQGGSQQDHMLTQNDDKQFPCKERGVVWSRISDLTRHMRTHTGVKGRLWLVKVKLLKLCRTTRSFCVH